MKIGKKTVMGFVVGAIVGGVGAFFFVSGAIVPVVLIGGVSAVVASMVE